MSKKNLEIHSQNILPIIKKWLYSDKDIFIRELVSNACDALHKVKLLRDQGKLEALDSDFRIDVKVDKEGKCLRFCDNGVGMTASEVEKYIAQIAFSGAEDFVEKYQTNKEQDQFIGHFGLGFYSSYMVADHVDIQTLSYEEGADPVFWSCDGSAEYTLEKGNREERGTEITLHVGEENVEFLEEGKIREILEHYCSFLPYPVYLGEQRINSKEPLWMKAPSECTDNDYKEFFRHLYPMEPEPLFWVHLNVDYPFNLKGILYFPKLKRDFEMKKSTVRLFCNRVYVSDDCKDVIPEYLMVLRGVIDSPDIPLNVSRSYLQMDRTVRQLATHISKKVSDSLSSLYKSDRERFLACWEDVSPIIKLGAVQDDKFYDRVKELLIWKNTEGEWTNVQDYLERNKEKTKERVLYAADATHHQSILNVYKEKGIEVLLANSPIDPYVINSLESKISPASFKRIDSEIDEHLIDKEREKVILDDEGKTEASKLADLIKQKIGLESLEVEAKSLVTDGLPAFIVMDENQRRMRDYMMAVDPTGGAQGLFQNRKMVVNTNSPLIQAIAKLDEKQPELAQEVASEVYELALLSHKEIHPDQIPAFVNRTQQIIEKLAAMATK